MTMRPSLRNRRGAIFSPSRRNAISHRIVASEPVTEKIKPEIDANQDRAGHVRGHPRGIICGRRDQTHRQIVDEVGGNSDDDACDSRRRLRRRRRSVMQVAGQR